MDSVKNDPDKQIWGAKRPRGVARSFSILTHGQNVRLDYYSYPVTPETH